MTRPTPRPTPSLTRAVSLILAGAGLACAGACGNSGDSETAVRDAAIILKTGAESDLASRGSGSTNDSLVDYRVRRLEEALETLSPHIDGDGGAYEGAAAVLAAVSENGLAIEQEARLVEMMRDLDNRKTAMRGTLGQWWKHNAVARSSATFDPKDSVEDLNRMTSMLEEDIEQIRQSKSVLDEKITSLRTQIDEAMSRATGEREEAGRLQLESSRATPEQTPALAEQVREHTRRADSYEFQGERLRTRLGQVEPDAEEKAKNIQRLQTQMDLLEQSRRQIAERVQTSADDAAAARRAAARSEAALLEQGGALNDFVENDIGELASSTERHLRSAVSNAGKAGDSARDSASLAKASAQHRLGDLHTSVAAAHESLSDLFLHLGSLSMENAARFTQLGEARAASAEEARQAASDAYASAARSLRSVRVRGDSKDALNALADRLEGVEPESLDEFGSDDQPIDDQPFDDTGDEPQTDVDD